MRRIIRESHGHMSPGQDLVMVGYAGFLGTRILAEKKEEILLSWFSKAYITSRVTDTKEETARSPGFWQELGASEWEPITEGGILAALWNISGAYQTGITVKLRDIPIRQVTVEICERFELNPYRLLTDGFLLAADHGGDLVEALAKRGIPAAVIGKVTTGIKRLIDTGEGVAYLDRPAEDELNRVLPGYISYKESENNRRQES